jgi:hypothetical protein
MTRPESNRFVVMKKLLVLGTAWVLLTAGTGAATMDLFQNLNVLTYSSTAPSEPPVDAIAVDNLGQILVADDDLLWDTQNTLYFTNRASGLMNGTLGFRLDNLNPLTGLRYSLSAFRNNGSIYATDNIIISATNLTVTGFPALLSADRGGRVKLNGRNLNLGSARIRAGEASERFNSFEGGGLLSIGTAGGFRYFWDEPRNLIDEHWGTNAGTVNLPFMSIGGVSGSFIADDRLGYTIGTSLDVNPPNLDGVTPGYSCFISSNLVDTGNNQYRGVMQYVFVQTNLVDNPKMRVFFLGGGGAFAPLSISDIWVEFALEDTDLLTGQPVNRYMYLTDSIASNLTAAAGLENVVMRENYDRLGQFRPGNFDVFRTDDPFFFGFETAPEIFNPLTMFYTTAGGVNGRFSTANPAARSGAYSFTIAPYNLSEAGFGLDFTQLHPLQDPTNCPGRIEITADQLNLRFARMRADNLLSVQATNITDMTGVRLEAPNLNLKLLSTSSDIVISNAFPTFVPRLHGTIQAWSGIWLVDQFVTNTAVNPIPGLPDVFGGNTIEWVYTVLVIEQGPSFLGSRPLSGTLSTNQAVGFQNLTLLGEDIVLNDDITVNQNFLINGECLYIPQTGSLTLGAQVPNFNATLAPNLICVTNEGVITVPGVLNMGFDRSFAYSNIHNGGTIQSGSLLFRTLDFYNSNVLSAFSGSIFIDAVTNRLAAGSQIFAAGNIQLTGRELAAGNSFLSAAGLLTLDFVEHLTDEGQTNFWAVQQGFSLGLDTGVKPSKGDLLSTTIQSFALAGSDILHFWAGENRGDDASGYLNNVALGRLILDGGAGSRHIFFGAGASNAMYLDTIEFANNATNFATAIYVDPSMTIYFANTAGGVAPDKLTNAFNGRFVWVSPTTYQGPMLKVQSSIAQSTTVAYRSYLNLFSASEDSDGDGVVNSRDATPLSGFTVNSVTLADGQVTVGWQAVAGYTYDVEYTTDLKANNWQSLSQVYAAASGNLSVSDPLGSGQRWYRVRFTR